MKKLYGIKLELDVFDDCVDLVWGDFDLGLEFTGIKLDERAPFVDGYHHVDDKNHRFIYIKNPNYLSTLVHELVHFAMKVSSQRGLTWSHLDGEHEVVSYMMGCLVDQFHRKYKRPTLILPKQKKPRPKRTKLLSKL